MKTPNPIPELDQLLSSLEEEGRNKRRQQALSEMIDHMAAEQTANKHRSRRLWTARIVAAACILFFITTAVRIWFIPTSPNSNTPMVAQIENPSTNPATTVADSIASSPIIAPHRIKHPSTIVPTQPTAHPSLDSITETIAHPSTIETTTNLIAEADNDSIIPTEPILIEEVINEPILVAEHTPPTPTTESTKPAKRPSFLHRLLSRPQPDAMDGTMLALRLL